MRRGAGFSVAAASLIAGCAEETPCGPVEEGARPIAAWFDASAEISGETCSEVVSFFDAVEVELSSRVEIVGLDAQRPGLRVEIFADNGFDVTCEDVRSGVDLRVESGRLFIRPGAFGIQGDPPQYRFRVHVPQLGSVAASAGACVQTAAPVGGQLDVESRFVSKVHVINETVRALSLKTAFEGCIDARTVETDEIDAFGEGEGRAFVCAPAQRLSTELSAAASVDVTERPCPRGVAFACAD